VRVERWRGGEVERWRGGEVERWRGGEVERWRGGEVESSGCKDGIVLHVKFPAWQNILRALGFQRNGRE
jgi:hypothetical protein